MSLISSFDHIYKMSSQDTGMGTEGIMPASPASMGRSSYFFILLLPVCLRILAAAASWLRRRRPTLHSVDAQTQHQNKASSAVTRNLIANSKGATDINGWRTFSPGAHYGLAVGEAGSSDADEAAEDDITCRELRRLQQSPDFQAWCRRRGMTLRDLEATSSRLTLYRRLRTLHPASFWVLCRRDTLTGLETVHPGAVTSVSEHLVSTTLTVTACGAAFWAVWHPVGSGAVPAVWAVAAWAWCVCVASWWSGRPAAGPVFEAWYEDVAWGHRAPAWRAALAAVLDAVYAAGTLGLGALLSVTLRCKGPEYQTIGERLVGVRMVLERQVRLDVTE